MFHVDQVASQALRTVFRLRLGAVVAIWPDGTITEQDPHGAAPAPVEGPLLSLPRTARLPTYEKLKGRLRVAATTRGLEFDSED